MYVMWIFAFLSVLVLMRELIPVMKQNKMWQYIVCILVAFIFILRFAIGGDTFNYIAAYDRVSSVFADAATYDMQRNIGYNAMIYFGKLIFKDYRYFLLFYNMFVVGLCSFVVWQNSKDVLLSTLLFVGGGIAEIFLGSSFRQMTAMSIFLFAFYKFIPKREFWKYEIVCLLAVSLHEIAVIALVIPLIIVIRPKFEKNLIRNSLFILLVSLFVMGVTYYILPKLGKVDYTKLSSFLHILYYFLFSQEFSLMGLMMELVFGAGLILLYRVSETTEKTDFLKDQMAVCLFTIPLYISFGSYQLVSRVCDFIQIIFLVLVPNLVFGINKKQIRIVSLICLIAVNAVLLHSDLNFKIHSENEIKEIVFHDPNYYEYFTVFDQRAIDVVTYMTE